MLQKEVIRLGRSPENDLVLPSVRLSRFQSRIVARDGHHFIEDPNSFNGTLLNGQSVRDLARLGDGDIIQLGEFRIEFSRA